MDELDDGLEEASIAAVEFSRQMDSLQSATAEASRGVDGLSRGLSRGLKGALDGIVMDGMSASSALKMVGQSMIDSVYNASVTPVTKHLGGLLSQGLAQATGGILAFGKGGAFAGGRVTPFAKGGVVSSPVAFPMRGGTGLMGEAGPEAIMPLTRGPDGRLGVAGGGGGTSVTINVTTPDVAGFRRSRSQIAAEMSRALSRGQRNG